MQASRFLFATGKPPRPQGATGLIHRDEALQTAITILQRRILIRAPISAVNGQGTESKGMGMSEQRDRRTLEREEIAERVASFKATQEKFRREREEYCVTTLENARQTEHVRHGSERPPFWS
jgi:hypothetical protein